MPACEQIHRGYRIRVARQGQCWRVRVQPITPEHPIFHRETFLVDSSSEHEAFRLAKQEVDRLLVI
jgi:hypothetical protein